MELITKQIVAVVANNERCGAAARVQRCEAVLTLRATAKRMKISATYLSYLERGRRNWTVELVERFNKATKEESR